jgi:hypothetical protein
MADALADLGSPVDDRILILNILRGLNPRFEHLGAIIRRYTPFSSFLKVWDDLILEELHLDSSGPSADATALYTCPAPAATRPPAPTPAPPFSPPSNVGIGKKGKNKKNAGGGRGRGGNSSNTTPTPPAPSGTNAKVPASWPTYVNPWQGHIVMYPGPLPGGFQRPATTQLWDTHLGSSSRPRTSPRHQPTGHHGLVRAGTSNRWRTPSTPWRLLHHPLPRTGWLTPALRTTPPRQLVISHTPVL